MREIKSQAEWKIIRFHPQYRNQVVRLVLSIQNDEEKIALPLEDQPDLQNIAAYFFQDSGMFWITLDNADELIGSIGLKDMGNGNGVLKKFFVRKDHRGTGLGLALYQTLYEFALEHGFRRLILDTPSVATRSHAFYRKAGFRLISPDELPFPYHFPDRKSFLFQKELFENG